MPAQPTIPATIMFTAALIAVMLGLYGWRKRFAVGGNELVLAMAAVAIFAGAYAAELIAPTYTQKIFWAKIEYIGIVNISPFMFLFAMQYSRNGILLKPAYLAGIWMIPLVTLGLVMTNEWHRLVWPEITPASDEPGALLIYAHGIGFWINLAYSYVMLAIGTILLIRTAWNAQDMYRWQIGLMVTGAFFPWVGNALYILGLNPWPGLDLTPLTFLITGILLFISIYRFRAFDITPIAHSLVFNNIGDGVLVMDKQNRLVDINSIASEWIGVKKESIGKHIREIIQPDWLANKFENEVETHSTLEIGEGDTMRAFELVITPIKDKHGQIFGRTALLHDLQLEHALASAESRSTRQLQLLNLITGTALMTPVFSDLLQKLADTLGALFDADGAFLTLWDEKLQRVVPAAGYGLYQAMYPGVKVDPGERTLTTAVLEAGRVIAVENARDNPYISPRIAAMFPSESILGLPLISDNSKLGAALISYNRPHHFTPEEIELGEQAARQIAISISKAYLFEAETRRSNQMNAMQALTQVVLSSLDLNTIFETIVAILHDTFKYPYISIYRLIDNELVLGAQIGYPEELIYYKVPITSGILGRAVRTKEAQFIQNVHEDPDFLRAAYDVKSEICLPVLDGHLVLGTLNIEAPQDHILTDEDMALMTTFANQVMIAIRNASLYEAERRNRQIAEVLFAAIQDFAAGLDTEDVLQAIVKHMVNGVGVDSCVISHWDQENDAVVTLLHFNPDPSKLIEPPGTIYKLADYPETRRVLECCEPNFFSTSDPTIDPAEFSVMEKYGEKSVLILPLITGHERQALGIVELYRDTSVTNFTLDELHLAMSLTSQAAVALENSYLYAEKQRLTILDELTGAHNRRGLFQLGDVEFERAARFHRPLSILFFDIDHFKIFNDRYSYTVGDQVLRLFVETVRENLRDFDLLGRYGGEEFAAILPETNLEMAAAAAERVRSAVEQLRVNTPKGEAKFTVSIGVCQMTESTPNLAALLETGGAALHIAKNNGRNRVARG